MTESTKQKQKILQLVQEKNRRLREHKIDFFEPYPWQKEFAEATSLYAECAAFKGNRVGGTIIGAAMAVYHATGLYPEWYKGKRFECPTRGLIITVDFGQQKRGAQRILFGFRELGYGVGPITDSEGKFQPAPMMPKDMIISTTQSREEPGSISEACIRHVPTGLHSYISFMSQKQSQDTLMGDELHWIWMDEFPENERMYTQAITRIETSRDIIFVTATPEHGRNDITARYLDQKPRDEEGMPMTYHRFVHKREGLHFSEEEIKRIIARCPPNERKFRIEGKPVYGTGLIFPTPNEELIVPWEDLPPLYSCRHIVGLDPGYSDYGALVWMMCDDMDDTWYVWDCERLRGQKPREIAHLIRVQDRVIGEGHGYKTPVSWGHDANHINPTSGTSIRNMLREEEVYMLPRQAHNSFAADEKNSVWPGIQYISQMMSGGKLKISSHPKLRPLWEEKDLYYTNDEGKIPKKSERRFDLIDALRYGLIMGKYAQPVRSRAQGPKFAITKRSINHGISKQHVRTA
jgi:phage terminase large subunit-like protein